MRLRSRGQSVGGRFVALIPVRTTDAAIVRRERAKKSQARLEAIPSGPPIARCGVLFGVAVALIGGLSAFYDWARGR